MDNPVYKVTSTELTSIASAIKTKLGINYSISYPFIKELKMLGGKPYTFSNIMSRSIFTFSTPVDLPYIPEGYFCRFVVRSISASNASYIGDFAFSACTTLSYISFPVCTTIGSYAFNQCYSLTTASFPSCTTIGNYAFALCSSLTTANFPACITIENHAFSSCSSLSNISFPACTTISSYAFYRCSSLAIASFPVCTNIGNSAFYSCYNLLSLYLLGPSVVSLSNTNVFTSTPISNYTTSTGGVYGSVYVPQSLVSAYKSASYWSTYSARIVGV